MPDKAIWQSPARQTVPVGEKTRSGSDVARTFRSSRLAELQRVERKRLDRFGRFGGR